ncbi:NAD+ kinase [Desulfonauticus submarinus]|uniref:NAD kinase n=1 Tax=Desulfonauticus submarinus TaxID=206665 RepID=A0A1H0ADN1_9BACT|nr:NAD(+)/NADH kinase [Desulfonauticus submarinus]SDN31093.1 NAD+ kinase [Desulfonauticus submarinus]
MMSSYFKNILLVLKYGDEKALELSQQIKSFLNIRGIKVEIFFNRLEGKTIEVNSKNIDLVIVVGGDGTLLSVARKMILPEVPFLGFNFGRVGFMAELEADSWQESLENILQGNFRLSNRLELNYDIPSLEEKGVAVNDIVLHRTGLARLLEFEITINKEEKFTVRADGVIAATPTGSSAYNFSAGGPLLFPELKAFVLTFICPFLCPLPSFVLPKSTKLQIVLTSFQSEAMLTIDGQKGILLPPQVKLNISVCKKSFILIQKKESGFVTRLKNKGILQC